MTFDRTLVIDTRSCSLRDNFSEFFEPREKSEKILFDVTPEALEHLNTLSCFPAEARGRLDRLNLADWSESHSNFVFKDAKSVPLSFDFTKDYDEAVLLHEQCGGGRRSFKLLEKIRLASKIRSTVLDRIKDLRQPYYGVHVRNTDLQTDYKRFFSKIAAKVRDLPLLVCSDDHTVIRDARSFFSSKTILTSSEIPDNEGKPLHYSGSRKNAIDAIVDLIALGRSEALFFATAEKGTPSGYSLLAAHLTKNKYLIADLLGTQPAQTASTFAPLVEVVFLQPVGSKRRLKLLRKSIRNSLSLAIRRFFRLALPNS